MSRSTKPFDSMRRRAQGLAILGLLTLFGCSSSERFLAKDLWEPVTFDAPLEQPLTVRVGESLFVRGSLFRVDAYELQEHVQVEFPREGYPPLRMEIAPCTMPLTYYTEDFYMYVAPGSALSVTSERTPAIEEGDGAGILRHRTSGNLYWFIDNHNYRGAKFGYLYRVPLEERPARITEKTMEVTDYLGDWVELYYAGYYNNLFHFELRQMRNGAQDTREFKFNPDPSGGPTLVGIQGLLLQIDHADNVSMTYRWKSIDFR